MSKPEKRPVHIAEIKKTYKGTEYTSVYLRRTFREGGKVQHETVGNLSDLPDDLLATIKRRLATGLPLASACREKGSERKWLGPTDENVM